MARNLVHAILFSIGTLVSSFAMPTQATETYIPPALEAWKDWVLQDHGQRRCPFLYNQASYLCVWPSQLSLNVNNNGANFQFNVDVFDDNWITIPGEARYWPQAVTVNGKTSAVRDSNGRPQLWLTSGRYTIQGRLDWTDMPRTITIPAETGLLHLTVKQRTISNPTIDNQQRLWLGQQRNPQQAEQQDAINVTVFRHLSDDIPFKLTTRLQLDVSGAEREMLLGKALLDHFEPMQLDSALPARIEPNGNLRLQAKPGRWYITLTARHRGTVSELRSESTTDTWPRQEIWVYEANPQLHTVTISGANTIDPQQTELPEEWRSLPAYLIEAGTTLTLAEQHRGDTTPSANQLQLSKQVWLDFDGDNMTVVDTINGQIHRNWRLTAHQDYQLGRVELDGEPRMITQLTGESRLGFEIRSQYINATTVSRLPRQIEQPASGWLQDFQQLTTTLHLPPGWSLLHAGGADSIDDSWISRWSLWDIFLVLIIAAAASRLCGKTVAAIALATLLLSYHRDGAPLIIWLTLLAVIALLDVTSGKFRQWLLRLQVINIVVLILIAVPFAVDHVRQAFYPQMEKPHHNILDPYYADVAYDYAPTMTLSKESAPEAPAMQEEIAVTGIRGALEQAMDSKRESDMAFDTLSAADVGRFPDKNIAASLQRRQRYDNLQNVQTGPGVPQWHWNRAILSWSGPVKAEETVSLFLIPPFINRIGNLLNVVLVAWFGLLLLSRSFRSIQLPRWISFSPGSTVVAILLALSFISAPQDAEADVVVDKELLQQLETRLTKAADCLPQCASLESVDLRADSERIRIQLQLHALEAVAIPLPLQDRGWSPQAIKTDGQPATVRQSKDGIWLIQLNPGQHQVSIDGAIAHLDSLNLRFGLTVHNLTTAVEHWEISGVENGLVKGNTLLLQRRTPSTAAAQEKLLQEPMPAFVTVTRTLELDLDWRVHTVVERVTPASGAINLQIPLLSGETPTDELTVKNNLVNVNFAPTQRFVRWHSTLDKADTLQLTAKDTDDWVEIWRLSSSDIWHTTFDGIPVLQQEDDGVPVWRPWPGESLTLSISRPDAVAGRHLTIEKTSAQHSLGLRSNTTDLTLSIRSSKGGDFPFTLPAGASLQSLSVDGEPLPLPGYEGAINIPLQPGEQEIYMQWQSPDGVGMFTGTPPIELAEPSYNNTITINLPYDRWPLLLGGPAVGPAVLLWGMLIVVIAIAIGLGRIGGMPLKTHEWILLGAGLGTANVIAPLVIVGWLLVLNWRGHTTPPSSLRLFRLMQIGLFLLSVAALLLLLWAVPQGLLRSPDMHIVGNGSTAYALHWYQDVATERLPDAWVISLPMWSYRLAMLAWSLWLALALLQWIRWAWKQLSYRAVWSLPQGDSAASNKTE